MGRHSIGCVPAADKISRTNVKLFNCSIYIYILLKISEQQTSNLSMLLGCHIIQEGFNRVLTTSDKFNRKTLFN